MISAELAPHKSYYTKLKRTLNIFLMLLLVGASSLAQSNIPKDYFGKPLDIPLILSGSFGELRSNHFHSGLDIKTQQRTGLPVYAPADGYVSRIKVGHYGYGKALYIKHPNGYSTVYAHLERYAGKIQDYVKKQQYRKESYEIELFPKADLLPVYKGDLIGYSGNTGSSGGPHLHFEIRDASSRPMNPMLFGLDVPDTRRPLLNSVMVYPVGDSAHVDQRRSRKRLKLTPLGNGSYKAETIKAYGFDKNRLLTNLEYSVNAGAKVLSWFHKVYKRKETNWFCRYNVGTGSLKDKARLKRCLTYKNKVRRWL